MHSGHPHLKKVAKIPGDIYKHQMTWENCQRLLKVLNNKSECNSYARCHLCPHKIPTSPQVARTRYIP